LGERWLLGERGLWVEGGLWVERGLWGKIERAVGRERRVGWEWANISINTLITLYRSI